jgi:hypothetical protein
VHNWSSIARRLGKLEAEVFPWGNLSVGQQFGNPYSRRKRRGLVASRLRLRFGYVRRLPEGYIGERHLVIAKHLPERNGQEWVEFEEAPGRAPAEPPPDPRLPQYLDIVLV